MMSRQKDLGPNEMLAMLGMLKGKSVQYPPELLEARRAGFVAQIASMQSSTMGKKDGSTSGTQAAGSQMWGMSVHTLETVLQYVLAAMVAVLVSTAAYVYRDELRALFNNEPTPEIQLVDTPLPQNSTELEELVIPSDTATTPVPTSVLATPEPKQNQPVSTEPAPTDLPTDPPPTKPGERIGHTKTPKPTQEKIEK